MLRNSKLRTVLLPGCIALVVPAIPVATAHDVQTPLLGAVAIIDVPDIENFRDEYSRDYEIDYPDDNLPNEARVRLGKTLFFDPRLSRSGGQSCASCHNPSFAWGDGLPVGLGDRMAPLGRRSPTILNLAWGPVLMWDGRAETLEEQALGPIRAEVEMNMPLDQLINRLSEIEGYSSLFAQAFDNEPEITPEKVALAIAAFERTIVSGMAPFDRWVAGEDRAISHEAKRGFALFNGQAKCSKCHDTWRFTDDSFHDIGLETADVGRGRFLPNNPALQHTFKTPTLRNVTERAPYMHAGQLSTLRDVVVHYNEGGIARPSRTPDVGDLGLSNREISDIVAFLESLTSVDEPINMPLLPR